MPTELTHVDVASAFRIALALGALNGVLVSLPVLYHWIETGQWVTGAEMGPVFFSIGLLLSIATAAITAAIVAAVFVLVYNAVARRYGGLEVSLSK